MTLTAIHGDMLVELLKMDADSIDSCVTDPPYHLTSIVKRFGAAGAAPAKGNPIYERSSRGFMGKQWDGGDIASRIETWAAVYRVLKPGGYLLAFGGTRTYHRMACAIEDAGFEIRDRIRYECSPGTKYGPLFNSLSPEQAGAVMEMLNDQNGLGSELAWEYGSGFPKSHDVSKGLDRMAGVEREIIGTTARRVGHGETRRVDGLCGGPAFRENPNQPGNLLTAPATDAARKWSGWGTALKPAHEPICVARKPLSEKTIAANVLRHGCGGINVDGCRVGDFENTTEPGTDRYNRENYEQGYRPNSYGRDGEPSAERRYKEYGSTDFAAKPGMRRPLRVARPDPSLDATRTAGSTALGRWPANVITDESEEVLADFARAGESKSTDSPRHNTVDNPVPDSDPTASILGRKRATTTFGRSDSG